MRTIIHVGQHKTGTTSTQVYLHDNAKELLRQGVYFPRDLAGSDAVSHFPLNIYALDEGRMSDRKEVMLRDEGQEAIDRMRMLVPEDVRRHYEVASSKGADTVLWSNEGLYLCNSDTEYQRVIDLFRPYSSEIVAVCCFRDVESLKESLLKQYKRRGVEPGTDPNGDRYLGEGSWILDHDRKRTLLNTAFDQCIFFDYEPADNVKAFMAAIGYEYGIAKIYRRNVSDQQQPWYKRIKLI